MKQLSNRLNKLDKLVEEEGKNSEDLYDYIKTSL